MIPIDLQEQGLMSREHSTTRKVWRVLRTSSVVLLAFLSLLTKLLYSQDALFIDNVGNVVINDSLFLRKSGNTIHVTTNAFVNANNQWQIKDPSKGAFTLEIRDTGMLELYGTKNNGATDFNRVATFDGRTGRTSLFGNVGIGTETPDLPLVVGAPTGGQKVALNDISSARWSLGTGSYKLHIANDWPSAWTDRMVITKTGNVGIGITDPNYTLDVNGDENVSKDEIIGGMLITQNATVKGDMVAQSARVAGNLSVGTLNVTSGQPPWTLDTILIYSDATLDQNSHRRLMAQCPADHPHLLSGYCGADVENEDARYTIVNYSGPNLDVRTNSSQWVCGVNNIDPRAFGNWSHIVRVGALCAK